MTFSKNSQFILLGFLGLLMFLTRGQHFAVLNTLPSASLAIFFILGFYIPRIIWFSVFVVIAFAIDFYSVTWGNISNFCVSPAYPFLIPSYLSLWLAGRIYKKFYRFSFQTLPILLASTVSGVVISQFFSSGSFYFLSGRFQETSWSTFLERLSIYTPTSLNNTLFYLSIAAVTQCGFILIAKYHADKLGNI